MCLWILEDRITSLGFSGRSTRERVLLLLEAKAPYRVELICSFLLSMFTGHLGADDAAALGPFVCLGGAER